MEPFYIQGASGPLFANLFACPSARDAFVIVPPFAEELNRSRHVMAAAARALAAQGAACLLLDLYGTGDSGGNFGAASWAGWLTDIGAARAELERRGLDVRGYIGLRTGALLAVEAARRNPVAQLVLWAPVVNGEQFLTQFLRIRVAEAMGRTDAAPETTKDLRARLSAGESLEIGGYELTATMADALSAQRLKDLNPPCPVHWIELSTATPPALTPAAAATIAAWHDAGIAVTAEAAAGPAFWSLLEPEPAPALVAATARLLQQAEA